MKRYLLTTLIAFVIALTATAQDVKRPESYNYLRGLEAMQNEKYDEAITYLNQEISDNPKNGYAYSMISYVRWLYQDLGLALNSADLALKYLPKKDISYITFTYSTRASIYLALEDTVSAINNYNAAIKADPKEDELYSKRAQIYYEQEKYDLADADYKKMIELKPGDVLGYMGLGRNANAQEKWEDALQQFNYVEKLAPTYESVHSFRAESYIGLKEWNKATDDLVEAIGDDWDMKTIYLCLNLEEQPYTLLLSKIKIRSAKSPNEAIWPYVVGYLYEGRYDYKKAIDYYEKANDIEVSPVVYNRISSCYEELGEFPFALDNINKALNMKSEDAAYLIQKASILYELGNSKETISTCDYLIACHPDLASAYYRRGWYKQLFNDYDDAIEDLTTSIVLSPDYHYYYIIRGNIYKLKGWEELAKEDYKKAIELSKGNNANGIYYAYCGIGDYEKAEALISDMLSKEDVDQHDYYEAACLYSRMNKTDMALLYLEKALSNGYKNITHVELDHDLDDLRVTEKYRSLIQQYDSRRSYQQPSSQKQSFESLSGSIKEIPFTKENGVTKVKCEINGLPLHFVFDTGASTVSLSMVEATFMLKNGYISKDDIVGSQNFVDANGNVSVGTIIILRSVKFGGAELNNVRASVVSNQVAPLLLGQSVLGRLGRIEIDNRNMIIRISDTNTPTTTNNKRTRNWGNLAPPSPPPPPPPAETSSSTTSESPVTVAVAAPPGTIVVAGPPGDPVNSSDDSSETILETVDVQPAFPGGLNGLLAFIQENIVYPKKAQKNFIQGTVQIKFVVNKEGYVVNPVVLKSLDPDCDKEAIRVISAMPRWKPGIKDGKKVNCYFSVPISFTLK